MGFPETMNRVKVQSKKPTPGQMTFVESLLVFDQKIPARHQEATIIFYNNLDVYNYKKASTFFDDQSAVVCFPDHYELDQTQGEGMARVTFISQYPAWKNLAQDDYNQMKANIFEKSQALVKKFTPGFDGKLLFHDTFTPLTIERFTSHINGTVYGSVDKTRDGTTEIKNLFIIGTDQGFLGIIGSMLSGISISNLQVLMNESI